MALKTIDEYNLEQLRIVHTIFEARVAETIQNAGFSLLGAAAVISWVATNDIQPPALRATIWCLPTVVVALGGLRAWGISFQRTIASRYIILLERQFGSGGSPGFFVYRYRAYLVLKKQWLLTLAADKIVWWLALIFTLAVAGVGIWSGTQPALLG